MTTDVNTIQRAERVARLQKLMDAYEPENEYGLKRTIEGRRGRENGTEVRQYAAVVSRNEGRTHTITLHSDIEDALAEMRGGAGSWEPDIIVDLDNGTEHTVEILPKVTGVRTGAYDHGLDTQSSRSRQHFIDTGEYLTLAESAEAMLDDLSEADYEKVTRAAEREYTVGATGLSEDDPRACIELAKRILEGDEG